jgi:uncharacterized membrane protein YkvA (DUF1232 family)
MAVSDEQIQQVLESSEMKAKVEEPATQDKIKAEFEKVFATVKGKLGDTWQDARTIYDSLAALAYLVSPIDLIPERFLGPLGLADDVAVLLFAINYAKPEIVRYRSSKIITETPQKPAT